MIPDEIQEQLYAREDISKIPMVYVFGILSALQEVTEKSGYVMEFRKDWDRNI